MGISKRGDRYRARLYHKGMTYNVGSFSTHAQASKAINLKRRELKEEERLDAALKEVWDAKHEEAVAKKPTLLQRFWRRIKR